MAKRDKYDRLANKELAELLREIDALYDDLASTIGFIGASSASEVDKGKPFSLSDYPFLKKRVDTALQKLAKRLDTAIVNGVRSQWTLANKKNDELCRLVFGKHIDSITEARRRSYFTSNDAALAMFILRKETGLSLSQRVWKYAEQTKGEIESTLELGIKTGEDATTMARDLREYLRFPDKLFRRVRDEQGKLHLSKNAAAFHPGQGIYRSSYKNARRLAATETNIAYRSADHLRQEQFDFVVGITINLSNNHTTLNSKGVAVPLHDICDELKGDYPKWFKFVGWHPQCRCFVTTILKTPEEVMRDSDGIDRGSVNEVKSMPPQWNEWVANNQARIDRAEDGGNLPYFLRDNEWAWKEGVELDVERPKTALLKADERHAARTPEQIADIKARWFERETAYDDARRVLRIADSIPGIDKYFEDGEISRSLVNLRYRYNTGNFKSYDDLRRSTNTALEILKRLRDERLSLLDKPLDVLRKWGVEKALDIQSNVQRTMSKYDDLPLRERVKKYRYEAEWIEEHRKGTIPTWKEAQNAYIKAAKELEWRIEWEALTDRLAEIEHNADANPALIERARRLLGKDKAAAEAAIKDAENALRITQAQRKFRYYLSDHPKLLGSMEDEMEIALDADEAERILEKAKVYVNAWENTYSCALAARKNIPDALWNEIQEAVRNDDYPALDRLTKRAELYAAVNDMRDKIRKILSGYYPLIEGWDYKLYENLQNDLLGGGTENAETISLHLKEAQNIIKDYNDTADVFSDDYEDYETKSKAYLELVRLGQKAISDFDLRGLKGILEKIRAEKQRLERDKKYAEEREAEWRSMSVFVNRVMALDVHDPVLDTLIASFVANESTKKVVKMAREDVAAIQARLAELGLSVGGRVTLADLQSRLGDKMPKTLRNLQKRIDKERAELFKSYPELKGQEETIIEKMAQIFENSVPGMNVPFYGRDGKEAVNAIFRSYFKSQLETNTGNGCVDKHVRRRASADLFGSDTDNMDGKDFEKYGFLMSKDILRQANSGIASGYWEDRYHHDHERGIQVRFKSDKVIATYTFQDSLGSDLAPALLSDPQITTHYGSNLEHIYRGQVSGDTVKDTREFASSYIELQYHGMLGIDAIESIFVRRRWFVDFDENALNVMRDRGIPLYTDIDGTLCTYNFVAKRWEATVNGKPSFYDEKDGQFKPI